MLKVGLEFLCIMSKKITFYSLYLKKHFRIQINPNSGNKDFKKLNVFKHLNVTKLEVLSATFIFIYHQEDLVSFNVFF